MKSDKKSLRGIKFSIWTAENILKSSVVEVTEKRTLEKGIPIEKGLRDPKLGPINGVCVTCGKSKGRCPGHFGHISLAEPVFHISWVNNMIHWLKCICYHCGASTIKESVDYKGISVPRNKMMNKLVKKLVTKCTECGKKQPKYVWNKERQLLTRDGELYGTTDILRHLSKVDPELIQELKVSHPKDMLLTVLPVPPHTVRPPIMSGNSIRGEDDLTYRLLQIIRSNAKLIKIKENNRPDHIIADAREHLQMAVSGYINHKKMGNARKRSSKREYNSLGPRLTGKDGRARGNLMGKRCDFTARTVITGDDNLGMHEVGVPISIANKLTVPVKVTAYNKESFKAMLLKKDTPIKFVVRPNGSRIDLSYVKKSNIVLDVGFTVERRLQDGDIVLFNRQPSLHKMSLMAHEVKVLPYSTFRMNLSCTTPYNADFDGDEMNLHALQTVESQSEARNIMAVKYQVVSPQSNRPVMSVIQDTLVGAYLLSADGVVLSKTIFMECAMRIPQWDGNFDMKEEYTGKDLISMVLPLVNWKRGGVEILKGKLIKGQLNKKVLGTSQGSLIHVIYNDCGPDETILFINRLQQIVHKWLTIRGFSIGISDMLTPKYISDRVLAERKQAFQDIKDETNEQKVNQRLNICRDSMGKMVQEPLNDLNRFYCTVSSGSKGSTINISQIMAVVGQQNLAGRRIPKTWTDRTLPHFERGSDGAAERGFIQHSYKEGLSPAELWFHAIAGREGIIDTACKTSITGYLQRRFMKALENIKVYWDKSARNADGMMIQFKYGDDGFDAMRVEQQLISTFRYPSEKKYFSISAEYQQLVRDHFYLKQHDTCRDPSMVGTNRYMLPINVARIIHNAKTLFDFPSEEVGITEIYERVCELISSIDNEMLCILIRSEMYSKKMVEEHHCTEDNLDYIIHEIKKQYEMIDAVAGESVGAVAAQSIGEPATQMTLNTFHFAGVSSKNVTLGIPRLEEIINCTKGEKLKSPLSTFTAKNMEKVVKQLRHITLEDLVHSYKLTSTPNKKEISTFMAFPDPEYEPGSDKTLVLYLKEWYDVLTIKRVIYSLGKLVCAYTDGPKAIFHIQGNKQHPTLDLDMMYEQKLKNMTIRGIPGAEYTEIVHLPGKVPQIETSLTDIFKLMSLEINHSNLFTNNIHAVKTTLGIEAARNTIIKEIRNILSFYGIYVNCRHILVIVDWMTNSGDLTPLTRHGIRRVDASPLKRSTFEEVVDVFNQAACFNEKDDLVGVSECIVAGAPPNVGTNYGDCYLDKEMEQKHKIDPPSLFEDMDSEEPWIMDDRPWESQQISNPFVGGGGFNANGFGQMGGMMATPMMPQMMPASQMGGMFYQPAPQIPVPQWQPSASDWNVPKSPEYNPNQPDSPMSPAYSPTSPTYNPHQPDSPMSPAYSPTSPHYDPNQHDGISTISSPKSPEYSPTSPAYYPPESPMSPAYSPKLQGPPALMYDPNRPMTPPPNPRKRKTFLEE